jgi:hypothetical protein
MLIVLKRAEFLRINSKITVILRKLKIEMIIKKIKKEIKIRIIKKRRK